MVVDLVFWVDFGCNKPARTAKANGFKKYKSIIIINL